jgi:colanic acid/amylovoran biosynthesis glycosyltransferase
LKLAIIVTEFPCITETFIARDLVKFLERGHSVRLFHLARYNTAEPLHGFATPLADVVRCYPYLASGQVLSAVVRTAAGRPRMLARTVADIFRNCWREPIYLAKSLAILPKSLAFAREIESWGVSHVHGEFAGHPGTAAWIIGRATGLPYSFSARAHDIFVTQALLKTKIDEAAFVRTISDFNVEFLERRLGIDRRRVHVVHSSIDVERIEARPTPRGETLRLLMVGSMEKRKGVDVLLRALALLGDLDYSCEFIGDGPDRTMLLRLAANLGVSDRVAFQGARTFEDVAEAYRSADLILVPSTLGPRGRTEGIPNVIIEALAYRRPVIASRISGIPELVEDGKTGLLVEPGSAEELAAAIRRLAEDPDAADRLAAAGRRAVEERFELGRNVDRQLALFRAHSATTDREDCRARDRIA